MAVQLMQKAAANGHVKLVVRRPKTGGQHFLLSLISRLLFYVTSISHTYDRNFGFSDLSRSTSAPLNQLNTTTATYDVILNRNDGDSFGFVIISSLNNNGSTIG